MLSIIIVNWNSGSLLRKCLSSIGHAKRDGLILIDVIIVDNASTDDSLDGIIQPGVPVRIVRNKANLGFAVACNQGAELSQSHYLLFLNPDTQLFENSLSVPLAFLKHRDNYNVGICGIQLVNEKYQVARSCAHFPSVRRFACQALGLNRLPLLRATGVHMIHWDHATTRDVDHVIGAFFLVRRTVFDALGGFDERFFVYLEDLDFSLRAHQAGWRSVYLIETQAVHTGGGASHQVKALRLFYSLRSRLQYGFKHFSSFEAGFLLFLTLALEPLARLIFVFLRGTRRDAWNTLKGYTLLAKRLSDVFVLQPR